MIEMSNKCFVLAGFLTTMCTLEVVRRLRKNQEVKFPVCFTTAVCLVLLTIGLITTYLNG